MTTSKLNDALNSDYITADDSLRRISQFNNLSEEQKEKLEKFVRLKYSILNFDADHVSKVKYLGEGSFGSVSLVKPKEFNNLDMAKKVH
jgi:hypothetical protein